MFGINEVSCLWSELDGSCFSSTSLGKFASRHGGVVAAVTILLWQLVGMARVSAQNMQASDVFEAEARCLIAHWETIEA